MIYLFFYAGSFSLNPRYSLQILVLLTVLAATVLTRPLLIAATVLSIFLPYMHVTEFASYPEALAADHRISVQFASPLSKDDLIVSSQPEVFINQGLWAMNAGFLPGNEGALIEEMKRRKNVWYHAGVSSRIADSTDSRTDQWVKSNFDLRPVLSKEVNGSSVSFYKIIGNRGRTPELPHSGHFK